MDPLPKHRKSEASYYTEHDFKQYGLDKIDYSVAEETVSDIVLKLQTSTNLYRFLTVKIQDDMRCVSAAASNLAR